MCISKIASAVAFNIQAPWGYLVLEYIYSPSVISLLTMSQLRSCCSVGTFYLSGCCIFLKRQGSAIKNDLFSFLSESLQELLKDSHKCCYWRAGSRV